MQTKFIKLGTAISSAALVAASFITPALALDVTISGNGASSDNKVEVENKTTTNVDQKNDTDIHNNVDVNQQTGGNDAKWNTGGEVTVKSGDAKSDVTVSNTANANTAEVPACNCQSGNLNIKVKDNGAYSDNKVDVENKSKVDLNQKNDADIHNKVDVDQKTGHNEANDNTGGSVDVKSGDATSSVTVDNTANLNSARLTGSSDPATLSVLISGNGAQSDNSVDIDNHSDVDLKQKNDADIKNDVDVDQKTGDNEANWNTGDSVSVKSGDADSTVDVTNLTNFNWANLDACGCAFSEDSTLTIKDNGAFSDNSFSLDDKSKVDADQKNDSDLKNNTDVDQKTGDNEVKGSTDGGDPTIEGGNVSSTTTVDNEGSANVLNGDLPDFGGLSDSAHSLFVLFLALIS